MEASRPPLLDVRDLRTSFFVDDNEYKAVNGASFQLRPVAFSPWWGSPAAVKSVTSYSILKLVQKPGKVVGGSILFNPAGSSVDLAQLDEKDPRLFDLRGGKISMIFQSQ